MGLLQLPLVLSRAHEGDFTLSEGGALATINNAYSNTTRAAAIKVAMRSGCHFAQLTVVRGFTSSV